MTAMKSIVAIRIRQDEHLSHAKFGSILELIKGDNKMNNERTKYF